MSQRIETDICVIGAGSAGLSVAAGASQMGARTVLVERAKMGGDCLNYGCVPSKALLAAGRRARIANHSAEFGIDGHATVDFARVQAHVAGVIAAIAPHDSVERFQGLGVTVIQADARFTGPGELVAGDTVIRAKRFVIATGSHAAIPPVPGLESVSYLTNETIFGMPEKPTHLLILGGGPIGLEMAQAHRNLGCEVTVIEMASIAGKDDPELVELLRKRLCADGIRLLERTKALGVAAKQGGVSVMVEKDGIAEEVSGSHLLVATGRAPSVEGLGLEAAGVRYGKKGIEVDARLRTSNRHIFAIGDVAGPYQFTHMAGYHAGIVIRNALFRLPAKVDYSAVPWVTYTDPELAQVGLNEEAARQQHGDIRILRWGFHENDRAQAERETEGYAKIVTLPNGRILGATILGPQAGELIALWALAVSKKMKIGAIASLILPYPTLGEVGKRAAGSFYTPKLFGERTRKIVRFLLKFG
ncbi:dihydrolipoyl dehydrogenase family protein [Oceanibaculum indicum]|uniref:Pyruvate/2-oxoglutarate dehydrogenase complex dihydrolipoamide dehydrogenase (E3) component n=1 Tax=Oceanibaculum indicum TaxID=526216 RepID=A0A420WCR7_9PROT|nr:FAD-dependent oxidoreductase [Oceanibaculum indicum]RKQ68773.1 pyruvate/2-oxoglutarate dehydrogenase complex dihydrolipoamide dehydrogenase (E3) component [Oceanibaculum indicum]